MNSPILNVSLCMKYKWLKDPRYVSAVQRDTVICVRSSADFTRLLTMINSDAAYLVMN